ncbi:response regulator transcription factor [Novosphingobium sp. G106]|uniref:response regulator transcription factor n=1 Tax=Novosphingobium sp. G106 TaxID=2849500 RepID=UPI001C2DE572|nr:response regulator transcription factor [Novosphingobium sp. G106]MBV1691589.1 response regulator transcription factor [Novosphingobium sp. G106]
MRLLVVEDDPVISRFISQGLGQMGHETALACCGAEAIAQCDGPPFDAIILDRMLPDTSGIALLDELRRKASFPPVVILSALGSVEDRIEGLDAGADDYLVKPFDMAELAARINAVARRKTGRESDGGLTVGALKLDPASHQAICRDRSTALNRKQYSLLAHMIRQADRLVTRGMLLEHVWGYSFEPATNIVESNMSRLRTKLLEIDCDPIETRRGSGYILRSERCA